MFENPEDFPDIIAVVSTVTEHFYSSIMVRSYIVLARKQGHRILRNVTHCTASVISFCLLMNVVVNSFNQYFLFFIVFKEIFC